MVFSGYTSVLFPCIFSVLFDRGFSEWDDELTNVDTYVDEMASDSSYDYLRHIRQNGMWVDFVNYYDTLTSAALSEIKAVVM